MFVDGGANKKTQKRFQNVTNPPLLTGSDDKLVLDILAVPELHLLLGIVDKLLREFENRVFETKNRGKSLWIDI